MIRNRNYFACCLFVLLLAACTAGAETRPGETGASTNNTTGPSRTATVRPMATQTFTPSAIPTVEPMVTPSPGPAPELEILNVTFPKSPNGTAFLGEIRNNSDQPMIFPGRLEAVRLGIEEWSTYGGVYYYHNLFDAFIKPGTDDKAMNCILYPGETGVIAFDFNPLCSDINNCKGEGENLSGPPSQMGYRLINYEAFSKRWEELYQFPYINHNYPPTFYDGYHLLVENIEYEIRPSEVNPDHVAMFFNFDVEYYSPTYQRAGRTPIWIVLYDSDHQIINILINGWVGFCNTVGCLENRKYHVYGVACNRGECNFEQWETPDQMMDYFTPIAEMTAENLRRVDHIRIVAENQDEELCTNTDFDIG